MTWLTIARRLCAVLMFALIGFGGIGFGGAVPALAQDADPAADARAATGGAQTLEDILRRQQALEVDGEDARRAQALEALESAQTRPGGAVAPELAPLGGASDSEMWRAVRYGASGNVSIPDQKAGILVQSGGGAWVAFRAGPLAFWGGVALGGVLLLLTLFYVLRGRIRVAKGLCGEKILRFGGLERFAHWLMAGSFILLALTGLNLLYGREVLLPVIGHEAFSAITIAGKWTHNNVSWAFMLSLTLSFFLWVGHNIPSRLDLVWFAQGGGIVGKKHPPARKFNAGQKIIFWGVMALGASVSASGLSLLFPFELPMFAKTFGWLNAVGFDLNANLSPQEEMQYASLWHAIVSLAMIVMIVAHIYIGSVGMEGAFDAMGSGYVDRSWAEEHHSLWVEEVDAREQGQRGAAPEDVPEAAPEAAPAATPAE